MTRNTLLDFWMLTKPEINLLIAIATFSGFYLGSRTVSHPMPPLLLVDTLIGTLLVAGGTGTLNQYIERRFDRQMRRTSRRPVASGRLSPAAALYFGIGLSAVGSVYLALAVNALASLLAILTLLSYLFVYTPLKRRTPLCTLAGAIPGAMPPLIGWAAATGGLTAVGWTLSAIVFLWQFPHFMAIAWMYREDYRRAGYLVLPQGRARASFVAWQTVLPLLALVPLTLFICPAVVCLLFTSAFAYFGIRFVNRKSMADARQLLHASIIYLPLLFGALLLFGAHAGPL
jgi:protoheme IX farnesyltransferase